jgi:hypothetical protein
MFQVSLQPFNGGGKNCARFSPSVHFSIFSPYFSSDVLERLKAQAVDSTNF